MDTDNPRKTTDSAIRVEYWDMPEIAALLRIVAHINIGGAIALCLWVATLAWGAMPSKPMSPLTGASTAVQPACRCERMMLVPLPPARRQYARLGSLQS